jgi:peptidoglycan/LPS O-acetylase OafA/YrhL
VSLVALSTRTVRRTALAGAAIGAAVGGTAATIVDAKSGPAFWAGLAMGAVVGLVCLVALSVVVDVVLMHRHQRRLRRT